MLYNTALLLGTLGLLISSAFPPGEGTAHSGDIDFESSTFMQTNFYRFPARTAVIGKDMLASGAWGSANAVFDSGGTEAWYLEDQAHGEDAVLCGISRKDTAVINRGFRAFEWGFRHQKKDGSFDCADNVHSTAVFIEAIAHSFLVLGKSDFAGIYQKKVAFLKPGLVKAAIWLIDPKVQATAQVADKPFTCRRYLMAAAIGETASFANDLQLQFVARGFIDDGLKLQDESGFNPEKGGFDCSYHALGLIYAHRYYDFVADDTYREKILAMYTKAAGWLASRVRSNGVPHIEGNTITGFGPETGREAETNKVNLNAIAQSLFWWSLRSKDEQMTQVAQSVADSRYKI